MSHHGCPERLSNRSKGFQEDGGQPEATMEVLVETLTGTAFEMTVSPSDTIFAIKSKICRVEGIPVSQQHIVFGSRELEDGWSLSSCGVAAGSKLRLVLGLRGGPVSTRRLPPPAPAHDPWRDIERLLHSNRDDGDWGCDGVGTGPGVSGGAGCRVTVVVFRDGERVNMLRVRENPDGTYSPAGGASASDHDDSLESGLDALGLADEASGGAGSADGDGALAQNAVTMGKMLELRRRMDTRPARPRPRPHPRPIPQGAGSIPKNHSEEVVGQALGESDRIEGYSTLGVMGLKVGVGAAAGELLADARPHLHADRLKLSDALAGSILVAGRREARDEAAIVEECLDDEVEHCRLRQESNIPAAEYGPLVGGEGMIWRGRTFGSSSQLSPPPAPTPAPKPLTHAHGHAHAHAHPAHARSASSLHVRQNPPPRHSPPLSDALFSSSTSDLEKLRRNRLLPALSRHRNTEHLHLSDDALHVPVSPPVNPCEPRGNITPLDQSRIFRFDDFEHLNLDDNDTVTTVTTKEIKEKKIKIRCGFCKKKLSIATVHKCRCGAEFCAPHRYAEVHGCAYDYKANAHHYLQRANPLVSAPKLPKI